MQTGEDDSRKKGYRLRRSIMDYGMGAIIAGIGVLIIVAPYIGLPLRLEPTNRYILGGLFLLYGGFRLYRGRQQDYFND
jgi:hypothetical protein